MLVSIKHKEKALIFSGPNSGLKYGREFFQ